MATSEEQEKLREASCLGNIQTVKQLIQGGVDVNSQNAVNGWTPLHWACKRNHSNVVEYLLKCGADASLLTKDGKTSSDLTNNKKILSLLPNHDDGDSLLTLPQTVLPIVPYYMKYPVFPYDNNDNQTLSSRMNNIDVSDSSDKQQNNHATKLRVIKARIANNEEEDFVEIELENCTSFENFQKCVCDELEVSAEDVKKIRKLPNILVRKDKDVLRLTDKDYLELVLKTNT